MFVSNQKKNQVRPSKNHTVKWYSIKSEEDEKRKMILNNWIPWIFLDLADEIGVVNNIQFIGYERNRYYD